MLKWFREKLAESNAIPTQRPLEFLIPSLNTEIGANLREHCARLSSLWLGTERYFPNIEIRPLIQDGPTCVANCLAMLTGEMPEKYSGKVNPHDPLSWSQAIMPYGMKLAYCPTDFRRVEFYAPELIEKNDLFLVCYYTTTDPEELLADPRPDGWHCGSHVVILKGDTIFDPSLGKAVPFKEHSSLYYPTKRIFRIVPINHERGL